MSMLFFILISPSYFTGRSNEIIEQKVEGYGEVQSREFCLSVTIFASSLLLENLIYFSSLSVFLRSY